jgi:penicillin V acylase-like amidase (Ntn superfamily)
MKSFKLKLFSIIIVYLSVNSIAFSCTRALYVDSNQTLTGRSMDWVKTTDSNLWLFPRGMEREGAAGPQSIKWKSKYGSVVTSFFDGASVDGMNERGLVANVLYLVESIYPTPSKNDSRKPISIAAWAQYVLDNYATVAETVENLNKEFFYVVPVMTPDGHPGNGHLAISDPSGDSAIFEYIDGKLVIHHDKKYTVMTNSPTFDKQLAINEYWEEIGGKTLLPGTSRAADRFVRAFFYINNLPKNMDLNTAIAGVFSVIRNASEPFGTADPSKPNISATLWRTLADQKNNVYYYESTTSPDVFWVDFKDLNFAGKTQKLLVNGGQIYAGNASKQFKAAEPFKFIEAPLLLAS